MSETRLQTNRARRLAVALTLTALAAQAWPHGQADDRWQRASPDRKIVLPADHASHPNYRLEWWYYTGNVNAPDGRRFGYQLTFFRTGVQFEPSNPSRWAVRDLHMAHLAITDVDGARFEFAERLDRGVLGLAGADVDRYHVWNGTWEVVREADGRHRLSASSEAVGLDLTLEESEPAVAHGRAGFSQKGSQVGNATHYYSLTRMATTGALRLGDETFEVAGASWMDHEFGTSVLEAGQRGWDWFSLQLDDGSELMVFQLRREDGSRDPRSAGTLVGPAGEQTALAVGDFTLVPGARWSSDATRAQYPIAWQLVIPSRGLELSVRALVPNQELTTPGSTGVTYWEGAVEVDGLARGRRLGGRGYLEMTGYAGQPMSAVLR